MLMASRYGLLNLGASQVRSVHRAWEPRLQSVWPVECVYIGNYSSSALGRLSRPAPTRCLSGTASRDSPTTISVTVPVDLAEGQSFTAVGQCRDPSTFDGGGSAVRSALHLVRRQCGFSCRSTCAAVLANGPRRNAAADDRIRRPTNDAGSHGG